MKDREHTEKESRGNRQGGAEDNARRHGRASRNDPDPTDVEATPRKRLSPMTTRLPEHHRTAVEPQVPMEEKEVQDHHVQSRISSNYCYSRAQEWKKKKRRRGGRGQEPRRREDDIQRRSSSYKTRLQHWSLISRASKHLPRGGAP